MFRTIYQSTLNKEKQSNSSFLKKKNNFGISVVPNEQSFFLKDCISVIILVSQLLVSTYVPHVSMRAPPEEGLIFSFLSA